MLDLGEALQHVLCHLSAWERQQLRSTCRALRLDRCLLHSVSGVVCERDVGPLRASDVAYLQKLNLRSIRFNEPPSLFHLHQLSALTGLRKLTLGDVQVADLMPLSCLSGLQQLALVDIDQHVNLGSLTRLSQLRLRRTRSTCTLTELTSLRHLSLTEGSHVGSLTRLSGLTQLQLIDSCDDEWEQAHTASALQTIQALPGLCVLKTAYGQLQALQLTQLTALYLLDIGGALGADLTALSSLKRLGLAGWEGCPPVTAPAITSVFLRWAGYEASFLSLPDLTACTSLQRLLLKMPDECDPTRVLVSADKLPDVPSLRLYVQQDDGWLFFETGLERRLRPRFVKRLTFAWEPEDLR